MLHLWGWCSWGDERCWVCARLSRLPPKWAPLLVRAAFSDRRHRLSSHRRSMFHLSLCFALFLTHSLIILNVFSPLFPYLSLYVIVRWCFVWRYTLLLFPCYFGTLIFHVCHLWNWMKMCLFISLCSPAPDFASLIHT
jgi:hypothetical protein